MQKRILIVGLFLLSGMAKGHPIAEDGYPRSYDGSTGSLHQSDDNTMRVGCLVVVCDVKKNRQID